MTLKDTALREKFRLAKQSLMLSKDDNSLYELMQSEKSSFQGLTLLITSDVAGAPIQAAHCQHPYWVSVFSKTRILAWSDEIAETYRKHSQPKVMFGSQALFDTNLWSDLPIVLFHDANKKQERARTTLENIENHFGKDAIDWNFGILENMREALKPGNNYPVQKSAAARYFTNHGLSKPTSTVFDRYIDLARKEWEFFLQHSLYWHFVKRRDLIYLLLLRTFLIIWKDKPIEESFKIVLQFFLKELNTYPHKEVYFVWKILISLADPNNGYEAFTEPPMKAPKKESIRRINSLAWDIYYFRWYEYLMTEKFTCDEPNTFGFRVPMLTTLDIPLVELLKACPCKALLIDYPNGHVEVVFEDESDFALFFEDALTPEILRILNDPERIAKSGDIDQHKLKKLISDAEKEIEVLY